MHITSLPSPYGIGSLGKEAYHFVDFLKRAHQSYWQVLPLGPTGFGDSPYQCFSAAAGNPYLIDLDMLAEEGLLTKEDLKGADCGKNPDKVDYEAIAQTRFQVLRKAFQAASSALLGKVWSFRLENQDWIEDYALFRALKDDYKGAPVWLWPDKKVQARDKEALRLAANRLKKDVDFYIFMQYLFFTQWKALRAYANKNGVQIIGDIPIYVSPDSCEVWAKPWLFKLNGDLSARGVAGVPPDYYSATGQLWGNPVYDWKVHEKEGFRWWIWRIARNRHLFDVIRIDHFRGFHNFWEIPSGEENAVNGKWQLGPDMKLFRAVRDALGDIPIIAEDLGNIDDGVRRFLEESGYPGMRVLIFGFDAFGDNEHLPHNYLKNSVAYTSTHDSDTLCQQVLDKCNDDERFFAYQYLRSVPGEPLGWSAIKSVWASPANLAMTTMQDLLSLGADARMNTPATLGGNWSWRVRREAINNELADVLSGITQTFKRDLQKGTVQE